MKEQSSAQNDSPLFDGNVRKRFRRVVRHRSTKSEMQNKPVRQHWVPKVYLRGFCSLPTEREQIHVYDTKAGEGFIASIANIAVKNNFYTLASGFKQPSYAVEEALSAVESRVAPVIAEMRISQELPGDPEALSALAEFVATLHMRTREGLQMIYGFREEILSGTAPEHAVSTGPFAADLLEFDDEAMRGLHAVQCGT